MIKPEHKVVQYLNEAHATELTLVQELTAQVAMTPASELRSGLQSHLRETRDHAHRIEKRLGQLEASRNPLLASLGVAETTIGQVVAMAKAPLNLFRGTGGEEKVLKNVKDACASEALEIATYTALGRLAERTGDTRTAELASSIREDEQKMLDLLLGALPGSPTLLSMPISRATSAMTSRRPVPPRRRGARATAPQVGAPRAPRLAPTEPSALREPSARQVPSARRAPSAPQATVRAARRAASRAPARRPDLPALSREPNRSRGCRGAGRGGCR